MSEIEAQLAQIRQAMQTQESLHATLPAEQVETILAALRQQEATLQAQLSGSGAVAQGPEATALGERASQVGGPAGMVVTGDRNIIILTQEVAESFWGQFARRPPTARDLRLATGRYLAHLVQRYRYLDFKGMGVSDRIPLRLPLAEMYVPLKARIELPEGETWARELKLAGRPVSPEEAEAIGRRLSEPQPVVELLRQHDGLIILGDPGAGKTTFLKYLAMRLALGEGEALGLGTRLPVLFPLSAYANTLAKQDVPLHRFIADYYRNLGSDLPVGAMLDEALEQGGALLLLDGLDEVKDQGLRHLVVERVITFFTFHQQQGNKFILTSRIVGYKEVRRTAEGLAECTLVDFDDAEIERFVEQWTGALERTAQGDTAVAAADAAREREELLAAVQHNPGVRRLAANPLLLTILALMKRQGVMLPERRVELYEQYVKTLLKHWNLARGLDRPPARDLDVVETVRVLAPLALWMHASSPGVGLVKREAMRRELVEIYRQRAVPEAEKAASQLLADARDHAGLLLERGQGMYGFIHLTFQEYLAAVAIAQQGQSDLQPVVNLLAAHIDDDNWHEVILLTIGYLGIVQQRDEAAGTVLLQLIEAGPGEAGRAEVLAGEAVLDAWPGGVTLSCKTEVLQALQAALQDGRRAPPRQRVAAGRALARLGDPRSEVMSVEGMRFCCVPAGPFWMGSDKSDPLAQDNEKLLHQVNLPYHYWIGQYPVTNAQFGEFAAGGGYNEARYWPEARERGYWQDGRFQGRWDNDFRDAPKEFGEPFTLANHPVVGVTWYEALAFTRWLTERWRKAGFLPHNWEMRLPSEAEWEKAARGGPAIPAQIQTAEAAHLAAIPAVNLVANPREQRRFPWGANPAEDKYETGRCNAKAAGVGTTSAVGAFPGDGSPYGVLEMAGNVNEWTRSKYQDYPYRPDERERPDASDDIRVIRGGSWTDNETWLRCAFRYGDYPYGRSYDGLGFRVVSSPFTSGL
ncbi:MAG: SUMF1/EgtB/PvdO family nonheme iron enzyme [Chloroflexi bacterium]|nr:SUMF1/EgtB/PvdO family nonheme iron enzyme [Chloroflexota bacterium]